MSQIAQGDRKASLSKREYDKLKTPLVGILIYSSEYKYFDLKENCATKERRMLYK